MTVDPFVVVSWLMARSVAGHVRAMGHCPCSLV
jgi:hypothetical protein